MDTPKNWQWRRTLQGRRVFLHFGAVDESCWVYVNGEFAGQHIFEKDDDWCTPFEIEITRCLDWDNNPFEDRCVQGARRPSAVAHGVAALGIACQERGWRAPWAEGDRRGGPDS